MTRKFLKFARNNFSTLLKSRWEFRSQVLFPTESKQFCKQRGLKRANVIYANAFPFSLSYLCVAVYDTVKAASAMGHQESYEISFSKKIFFSLIFFFLFGGFCMSINQEEKHEKILLYLKLHTYAQNHCSMCP